MTRKMVVLLISGAALGIVLIAGFGVATWRFLGYRAAGPDLAVVGLRPQVEILQPNAGDTFQVGHAIEAQVSAVGTSAVIVSTELWIDGSLAETRAAPPGGRSVHLASFIFAAARVGPLTIMARTADEIGRWSLSVPVVIDIGPNQDGQVEEWFAPETGHAVTASGHGVTPPAPLQTPDGPAAPAGPWQGTLGDWLTEPAIEFPPAAPTLLAESADCSVVLTIHDAALNEEGYLVHRRVGTMPAWTRIATLAAGPAAGWLSYSDESVTAAADGSMPFDYYVEAFHHMGSAPSNVVSLSPDLGADCPPLTEGLPPMTAIEFAGLAFPTAPDRAYCYRTFDGASWHRWPSAGFFLPGDGALDLADQVILFMKEDFRGKAISADVTISLDCWGWMGGDLVPLGNFNGGRVNPDLAATLNLQGEKLDLTLETYSALPDLIAEMESATLPLYSAHLTFDPAECQSHLTGAADLNEYQTACSNNPAYHYGPEGVAPQPYFVWEIQDGVCQAGTGFQCIAWDEWLYWWGRYFLAGSGHMFWSVEDTHGPGRIFDNPYRMAYALPPPDHECDSLRVLTVALHVDTRVQFRGPIRAAYYGCEFFEPMPDPQIGYNVEVNFSQLVLQGVSDALDDEVELDGYIEVWRLCHEYLDEIQGLHFGLGCPEPATVIATGEELHSWTRLIGNGLYVRGKRGNGAHSLGELALGPTQSVIPLRSYIVNPFGHVRHGGLLFQVRIYDRDEPGGGRDDVCVTDHYVGFDAAEWMSLTNHQVSIHAPHNGTAECWVDLFLTSVE